MTPWRQPSILIGDRVRCYALPGVSKHDYITGIVVGYCRIAGLPRVTVAAESRTTHGQEDPCQRRFQEPLESIAKLGSPPGSSLKLHQVA
jgi:hypothetical protein